jgi:hypothetical protein
LYPWGNKIAFVFLSLIILTHLSDTPLLVVIGKMPFA